MPKLSTSRLIKVIEVNTHNQFSKLSRAFEFMIFDRVSEWRITPYFNDKN